MDSLFIIIPAVLAVVVLLIAGFTFSRLYRKTKADEALVRTGLGGPRVILGGGGLILPGLHEVTSISMRTMSIRIEGGDGLITQDNRRVDVISLFAIRVSSTQDAILKAAQSLGSNTNDTQTIRVILEGKVQDVMRAIAAGTDLIDLHRNRAEFQQSVYAALNKELIPNGLELESVSITKLDETPIDRLDENNSFDIAGMHARSFGIAENRRARVKIEEEERLDIARTQQSARINLLTIQREEKAASEAQSIGFAELAAESKRRQTDIESETQRRETEIQQQVRAERERNEIERNREVQEAQIAAQTSLEVSKQKRAAEIAVSSEAQSHAEARASEARATAIAAEETVNTARIMAVAEREKQVAILEAEREAEQKATTVRVHARVEREAAADQSLAVITRAEANAKAITIEAEALREKGQAEVDVARARIEADNMISSDVMAHKERMAKIEALPAIIQAMVEPARHIDSINVHQITGINGLGGSAGAAGQQNSNAVDAVFDNLRANAVAMPLLNKIGADLGINFNQDLGTIAEGVMGTADAAEVTTEATETGLAAIISENRAAAAQERKGQERPAPKK